MSNLGPSSEKTFKKDPRAAMWKQQRKERGFDDTELWNLDTSIAKFLVPRLKEFQKQSMGYPINLTPDKWNKIMDIMIKGFEFYASEERYDEWSEENTKNVNDAFRYLKKYFVDLWW